MLRWSKKSHTPEFKRVLNVLKNSPVLSTRFTVIMVADLCHVVSVVFSGRKRKRSPRENPPNCDFGEFSLGDLSPRQAKIDKQYQKTQRVEYRVLSSGGAKSRHAKTRTSHHLAGFRVAHFRSENTLIRHGTNQPPYSYNYGSFINLCLLAKKLNKKITWNTIFN